MVREGKKINGPEQLRDAAQGSARIRGDTLGIVGLGESFSLSKKLKKLVESLKSHAKARLLDW